MENRIYDRNQRKLDLRILELKYRKGIEIIQLIFEKILALDHHFSSLNTFQQINALSNPHSYPEFVQIHEKMKEGSKKRSSISMPTLLESNSMVSLSMAVISSIFGNGNKKERENELMEISCLLDFTVRMHSDLKVIYFETDFLKLSNEELLHNCIQLFKEYTKVISYHTSLERCRSDDDWDSLDRSVDGVFQELKAHASGEFLVFDKDYILRVNNLEFTINRLLKFIEDYDRFINQAERYYQKFLSILETYNHRDICIEKLPVHYTDLEEEIKQSIDKFRTAYRITELQGTKLRDLLYGEP